MSSPGLRERKKQKTRWAIQEHAVRLFVQQGYDATTVEQIAEAAEISPSTFFRYFKTKEDVVIQDRYDDLMVEAIRAAPPELSPLDTVRRAFASAFGHLDPGEIEQVLQRAKLSLTVPALRMRLLDNMQSSIRFTAAPLAERLGRAPDDFRTVAFMGACVGALINAIMIWVENDGVDDPWQLVEEALSVIAEGP
ncbi:TetR family transcriptional regulator [Dactylosporangium roseum]|uniref:TetR family transcriptional regulator n=1 Tax=Dactylosporangium roseum TaxID=47989 RepID=A0ABY5Z4B6_9ACTN|nr:TetR family transcriptional regulator [Dactylosporangium roseum]UWZ36307.1 TetR family transcriptional regulator [Dactylosporangium roseum]